MLSSGRNEVMHECVVREVEEQTRLKQSQSYDRCTQHNKIQ